MSHQVSLYKVGCCAREQLGELRESKLVDTSDERKSISSETTFLEDTDDRTALRQALKESAEDVANTLTKHAIGALTLQIKVRYSDFTTLTRQLRLEEP